MSSFEFNMTTCIWLGVKFGSGSKLNESQFCELLNYVEGIKGIFTAVDVDRSGCISCAELHRAFLLSGCELDVDTVTAIGQSYDGNRNGTLELDEFIQFKMEWDTYIGIWDAATSGLASISPTCLLNVLEKIKQSMEPVGKNISEYANSFPGRLLHTTMFNSKTFDAKTCEKLIIRFGQGLADLTFGQFCRMLLFLSEVKAAFCRADPLGTGSLDLPELHGAFASVGVVLPADLTLKIRQSYDTDSSGKIEFDEFVQMTAEWQEMVAMQHRFDSGPSASIGAAALQEILSEIHVFRPFVHGVLQPPCPFSMDALKHLIVKFGNRRSGESYPTQVTHENFLCMVHYVRYCQQTFSKFAALPSPITISVPDVSAVFAECGLSQDSEAVASICRSFGVDQRGRVEFEKFLHMLLEASLYDQVFSVRLHRPDSLTPFNVSSPLLRPSSPFGAPSDAVAHGTVILDRSSFLSLVFSVPRNSPV